MRIESPDELRPKQTRGTKLCDLHEIIHADSPKETEPWREAVNIHTCGDARPNIFQTIGQGIAEFNIGGGPCFLHMIARNRDGIKLGHIAAGVIENIRDNSHAWLGRVNIGVAHHELFQNVILDRARELFLLDALFFSGSNIKRENGEDRPVHRHGYAHFIQWNFIE